MVRDSIVQPIAVRPGIAPSLGFTLETDLDQDWRVALGFSTAWTRLSRHSAGSSARVVPLTWWTPLVSLSRLVLGPVTARVTVGAIAYDPDYTDGNLFSGGAPIVPLVGFVVGVEQTRGNSLRYAIELGYDLHRFSTSALRDEGFSGEQAVHRVSLSIALSRIVVQ